MAGFIALKSVATLKVVFIFIMDALFYSGAIINDVVCATASCTYRDCISDLENFLNNEEIQYPHLIRMGIAHSGYPPVS